MKSRHPATNIAKWNGSSWSPLGSWISEYGYAGYVYAMVTAGSNLYVGGMFTTAGGIAANNIAQWNGSSWSALGSGINGYVEALAASGSNVFAGGEFTTAGGNTANDIAGWDGSPWFALGSGMDNPVYVLVLSGDDLYAGGAFTMAGGKVSGYAAEAIPVSPEFQGKPVRNANGSITLNLSTGTNTSSRLCSATNLSSPVIWQPIITNFNGGLWQFTDTNTASFKSKFYRLSSP